jgi:hypothetical protein
VGDLCDNCPINANNGQQDRDADGVGDACENADSDMDGVVDDAEHRGPDQQAGGQIAEDGTEAEAADQGGGNDHGSQQGYRVSQTHSRRLVHRASPASVAG